MKQRFSIAGLFLFLFLVPIFSFGQLDKIQPGISVENFKTIFPAATIDPSTGKDILQTKDSIYGEPGNSTYTFFRDTINQYKFVSVSVPAPCKEFPSADSSSISKLLNAARKSYSELSEKFGVPDEKFAASFLFPVKSGSDVSLFGAKWRMKDGLITIKVKQMAASENSPNQSCFYVLEIFGLGNSKSLFPQYNLRVSKNDFKNKYPSLAGLIKDSPQLWLAVDSVYHANGEWRGRFENGKLVLFSFNAYDGNNYVHDGDEAYGMMCKRLVMLNAEAIKQFGSPDSSTSAVAVKYVAPSLRNSYAVTHYYSRWKVGGNYCVMKMEETGGGINGPSVFHLSVYYDEK